MNRHDGEEHEGHHEGCPMIMTVKFNDVRIIKNFSNFYNFQFHVGHCESILFKNWTAKTVEEFILALVLIFIVSVAYEGLKFWREKLYNDYCTDAAILNSSTKTSTSESTNNQTQKKSIG